MTDARVVIRLRTLARQVLADRDWALGLEVDDLIGEGWLAYREAARVAHTPTYAFARARFAMFEALRTWYNAQRHTESSADARAAGRCRSRRAVRWTAPVMIPWQAMTPTPDGPRALADITPAAPPAPSWSPNRADVAALERRLAALPPRAAAAVRLALAGETVRSSADRLGVSPNAIHVARSVARARLSAPPEAAA